VNSLLANTRRRGNLLRIWIALLIAIALSLFFAFSFSGASADTTNNVVMTVVESSNMSLSGVDIYSRGIYYVHLGTTDATCAGQLHVLRKVVRNNRQLRLGHRFG